MKRTIFGALAALALAASAAAGPGHACSHTSQECLDMLAKNLASKGWLGVKLEMNDDKSITLMEIVPGSPAERAGFRKDDVLLAIGGSRFDKASDEEMEKARGKWEPGQKVEYTVRRGGKETVMPVTLGEMPDSVRYEIVGQHMLEMHAGGAALATAYRELSVEEVAKGLEAGKIAAIYDVNGPEIREKFGVVPKAKLLTSSSGYELASLPADKESFVVFYCANTRCTASDAAAKRAAEAGYKHVAVMRPGIAGWKDAGQPTSKPPQT